MVLDSLGDLLLASPDEIRFRELMYSLSQRLARRGVSLMITLESVELFESPGSPKSGCRTSRTTSSYSNTYEPNPK